MWSLALDLTAWFANHFATSAHSGNSHLYLTGLWTAQSVTLHGFPGHLLEARQIFSLTVKRERKSISVQL